MAAGLAHEINNPLTAILWHTQLLLQSKGGGSPNTEELGTINLAAQRIARVVQEFMRFTSLENTRREGVDLCALVRAAAADFEKRHDARDIALNLQLPMQPQWVRANPALLNQVLLNLLLNSLEAILHGGTIDVEVSDDSKEHVVCEVRDSGAGIAEPDLKRVFEPGYTTKVEAGIVRGVGLGLYTAERIIRNYGGTIQAKSAAGRGTTVTFSIPRVPGNQTNAE